MKRGINERRGLYSLPFFWYTTEHKNNLTYPQLDTDISEFILAFSFSLWYYGLDAKIKNSCGRLWCANNERVLF
jgi:hypothetical protein